MNVPNAPCLLQRKRLRRSTPCSTALISLSLSKAGFELDLGLGFYVDDGPRLPWRFVLVLVDLGHGPVLLCRLPFGSLVSTRIRNRFANELGRRGLCDRCDVEEKISVPPRSEHGGLLMTGTASITLDAES